MTSDSNDSSNTIIVDCDGVIADKNNGGDYSKAGPLQHGIDQVSAVRERLRRVDDVAEETWGQVPSCVHGQASRCIIY